jgi:hypothetical protein
MSAGVAGMSEREMARCLGVSRKFIALAFATAAIPEDEFEAAVESDDPPECEETGSGPNQQKALV